MIRFNARNYGSRFICPKCTQQGDNVEYTEIPMLVGYKCVCGYSTFMQVDKGTIIWKKEEDR